MEHDRGCNQTSITQIRATNCRKLILNHVWNHRFTVYMWPFQTVHHPTFWGAKPRDMRGPGAQPQTLTNFCNFKGVKGKMYVISSFYWLFAAPVTVFYSCVSRCKAQLFDCCLLIKCYESLIYHPVNASCRLPAVLARRPSIKQRL